MSRVQQTHAQSAIEALKAHPSAWEKVDTILQHSSSDQSKFIALQVSPLPRSQVLIWHTVCHASYATLMRLQGLIGVCSLQTEAALYIYMQTVG